MLHKLVHLIIVALAVLGTAYLLPGIYVGNFVTALVVAAVLGVVNLLVRPILVIFTLPITVLTLGFFLFVINGLLLWFVSIVVPGFEVLGFVSAIFGSILISVLSWAGDRLILPDEA